MKRPVEMLESWFANSWFERATSRRLLSVLLLCLGVANLVWLNGQIYPHYRGPSPRSKSASLVPESALSETGEIDQGWMKTQLSRQPAFVVLPFEKAGYLPKLHLAQIRNFALELAKRQGNYWVLVSGAPDPEIESKRADAQSQQRVAFVRDLLVQSGLKRERVLLDPQRKRVPSRVGQAGQETRAEHAHLLLDIRVLEVQSQ